MNSSKLTRRQWFRLRSTERNPLLGEKASTDQCSGLQPIDHPPNYDGLDLSQLPPMREATLDRDQIDALFSDIVQLASDICLMQHAPSSARAAASKADSVQQLELAKNAFLSGSVQRLQIRYRWQESLWIDTLKHQSNAFHLVRICHAGDAF